MCVQIEAELRKGGGIDAAKIGHVAAKQNKNSLGWRRIITTLITKVLPLLCSISLVSKFTADGQYWLQAGLDLLPVAEKRKYLTTIYIGVFISELYLE